MGKISIAVHGGAGRILPEQLSESAQKEYHSALSDALTEGRNILQKGGSAIEAVEIAVVILEDNPLFNAGKGSVFAHNGRHVLEASMMDGAELRAGSAAGLQHVKNPIKLARKIMENSSHIMMIGAGAEAFARESALDLVDNKWFSTDFRKKQLESIRDSDAIALDHTGTEAQEKYGTVGAVALDESGNLAAATSTGGVTNKRWGRVGDSPLIGCGTYAQNGFAAISTTGYGEAFIRKMVAYDLVARMRYGNQTLEDALQAVLYKELPPVGGEGGLIAINAEGEVFLPFSTPGMYRGFANAEELKTFIFKN